MMQRWPPLLLAGVWAAAAAAPPSQQSQTTERIVPPALQQPQLQASAPQVTGFGVRGCVTPGDKLTVSGKAFAPRGQRQAVLGGNGIHIDLDVASWDETRLVVHIPEDRRIRAGEHYYIGIEAEAHGPWISNIDRRIEICPAPAVSEPAPTPGREEASTSRISPGFAPPAEEDEESAPATTPPATGGAAPVNPFGSSAGQSANYAAPALLQADREAPQAAKDGSFEPGQLLVWHRDRSAAQAFGEAVRAAGYRLRGRAVLDRLGVVQTTLGLPQGQSVPAAAAALRARFPDAAIAPNHRYRPLRSRDRQPQPVPAGVGWSPAAAACGPPARVGVIDTAVADDHPAFAGRDVLTRSMLPAGIDRAASEHGTLIAARLASLLPAARLRVAAVFRQRDETIVDTTAEWLLQGLDWLVRQDVAVINMSLGGPENPLLGLAVERVLAHGIVIVAAVGESGPGSAPAYPAAWQGVVGVTAVDADGRGYERARQGPEVDFAAPGVDLRMQRADGSSVYVTGTSHAAPFVAAAFVLAGDTGRLRAAARDLGTAGRDDVYGHGLVQFASLCDGSE